MRLNGARRPGAMLALIGAALLSACAGMAPPQESLQQALAAPPAWAAKLPDAAAQPAAEAGKPWWERFDDPLLALLIARAEATNPNVAQVVARVVEARALAGQAAAAQLPLLSLSAAAQRAKAAQPIGQPVQTLASASLDASWEINLFARVRQQAAAAAARAEASLFDAHALRLTLAAEVAQTYVGLRACERLADIVAGDAEATDKLARLSDDRRKAGFEAPASHALLSAAAADAANRLLAQRADCDLIVKGLVALTGEAEPALRAQLAERRARLPETAGLAVAALPADVLARRPDLVAAQRQVAAAWSERGAAEAARYPQLQLLGSLGIANVRVAGGSDDGRGWSFGPSLTLPLFDAGLRRAQADAAQARFEQALGALRGQVVGAVREVEEALVRLDAASAREGLARRGAEGYGQSFAATESRWRSGLASAAELEDARRLALSAQAGLVQVQRERIAAWITLYKAVGGGWDGRSAG